MRSRHPGLQRWDADDAARSAARAQALAANKRQKKRAKPSKLP